MEEIIIDGNNISRVGDLVLEFMLKTGMYQTNNMKSWQTSRYGRDK